VMVISTLSNRGVEEITRASTRPTWFQLYVEDDRAVTKDLVLRAQEAGCRALCITVDLPIIYARDREAHLGNEAPQFPFPNLNITAGPGGRGLRAVLSRKFNWKDLEWIQSFAKMPILLKGVLNPDDAEQAAKMGAAAVVVSNHGGRALDSVPATIDALPAIVDRVASRIPVLVDGGIRRGTDVLKGLANGATAVLIGRPYLYGRSERSIVPYCGEHDWIIRLYIDHCSPHRRVDSNVRDNSQRRFVLSASAATPRLRRRSRLVNVAPL